MTMTTTYSDVEPARTEIDATTGPLLLEFGSPTCGHCRAAQTPLDAALAAHGQVRHLKIEDGRGRPLGRSFGVRRWPTLVFLADGREVSRLVRPLDAAAIGAALAALDLPG